MNILLAGSSGLVGKALRAVLKQQGHQVVCLIREASKLTHETLLWNPNKKELDLSKIEGFDAFINLAGENITADRWNEEKKKEIKNSRINSTSLLAEAVASLAQPPKLFLNASAVGFYGDTGAHTSTESTSKGKGFLADVCEAWELAADKANVKGVKVIKLRIGVVLSKDGGALAKMIGPFKAGMGGVIGSGEQYVSWIALDDLVGIISFLLKHPIAGPVNAVSPNPVTNKEFTGVLGNILNRPTLMKVPAFAARMMFGEMADALLLASSLVKPVVLEQEGYKFMYPTIEGALKREIQKDP